MTVVITPIENNEQWLALKLKVLGASEIAALFGVHEYLTYYGLWARKSGRIPPQPDNEAMERGRLLEPVAVEVIRDRYPQWRVTVPHEHYADHEFGIGATPDLLVHDPERGQGVVQIKSVAPSVFRRAWRSDSDAIRAPIWIVIQALMEQHLTGAQWAAVAPMVVDHRIDLEVIDVPEHPAIVEHAKSESIKFWEIVFSGREPDPDYKRDGELIRAMLRQDDGSEIDLSGYNDMPDLVAQRETALAMAKQFKEEADDISAQLLHRMGTASFGRFNGGYLSAKTVNRPAYQVKASSYRQLRVVKDREQKESA
jgi:YqaJ-like viral recombinase domain